MGDRATWYTLEDGRRHVLPYRHTFQSFAKARWVGRHVLEVLQYEFPQRCTPHALAAAMTAGELRLNGKPVREDAVFRSGDRMEHDIHREEPSVPAVPIETLPCGREDLLALNKPAGIPVHHAGRYRRNTLVEILQLERPDLDDLRAQSGRMGGLHILHRLDIGVSGG